MSTITTATPPEVEALLKTDGLTVIYFWGPECPNCEVFAADLPTLMKQLRDDVHVIKVNAYEHPEFARRFGLFGIPGFVLYRDGSKLGMMRQYHGREYWLAVVNEHAQGLGASRPVDV